MGWPPTDRFPLRSRLPSCAICTSVRRTVRTLCLSQIAYCSHCRNTLLQATGRICISAPGIFSHQGRLQREESWVNSKTDQEISQSTARGGHATRLVCIQYKNREQSPAGHSCSSHQAAQQRESLHPPLQTLPLLSQSHLLSVKSRHLQVDCPAADLAAQRAPQCSGAICKLVC